MARTCFESRVTVSPDRGAAGRRMLVVAPLAVALATCGGSAPGDRPSAAVVRVAAAADLRFALEDIIRTFARARPGTEVRASYGSSGTLYAQLVSRAPFDIYLAADVEYARKLVAELGLPEREFVYAIGYLVLWVPRASPLDLDTLGMRALVHPSVRRIALANPEHAPYGRAAVAAMRSAGIYDAVRHRLALGENLTQAAQFVQAGAADAGVIGLALATAPEMRAAGRFWKVPDGTYPALEQGGIILPWAADPAAARAFRDFLLSEEGQRILGRYGFDRPKSEE